MIFKRKLPVPQSIKAQYPMTADMTARKAERDEALRRILSGRQKRLLLVIGPCSADNADAVVEYVSRLRTLQETVQDKIFIVPRVYTEKPRSAGMGYMGMLHRPDPLSDEDMLGGIIATRQMHLRVIRETGFTCADEMLYPENHRYLSDLLSYVTVGARSVEDQQHRLCASGLDIPVGMKNPTSGDLSVLLQAVSASQLAHTFIYRGWEVTSDGNPFAHAILRGAEKPNYTYDTLAAFCETYRQTDLANKAVLIDTNHANSEKNALLQGEIAKNVLLSCKNNTAVRQLVKGFMIESYLQDGAQSAAEQTYGKSITDPCLGWEKTERLVLELASLYEG